MSEEEFRRKAYDLVERELRSIPGVVDYTVNTPGVRYYSDGSETSCCVWAASMIAAVDEAVRRTTPKPGGEVGR